MDVGKKILEYREQKTIMITELADRTGIAKSRLMEIESGDTPTLKEFRAILDSLGVSPLEFFRSA